MLPFSFFGIKLLPFSDKKMQDPTTFQPMKRNFPDQEQLKYPRCESSNTKFCYCNNYNLSQPCHFCKNCKRYWTKGGALRSILVGGGTKKLQNIHQILNIQQHHLHLLHQHHPLLQHQKFQLQFQKLTRPRFMLTRLREILVKVFFLRFLAPPQRRRTR